MYILHMPPKWWNGYQKLGFRTFGYYLETLRRNGFEAMKQGVSSFFAIFEDFSKQSVHQIWQKIVQTMKKSLIQLALNPFLAEFSRHPKIRFWVPVPPLVHISISIEHHTAYNCVKITYALHSVNTNNNLMLNYLNGLY